MYLDVLKDFDNPFSERGAQKIVEDYLKWKKDHGLLGMIRINDYEDENIVELDAAIRYVIDCEPSTCPNCG
ncbi:hypothetical protein [Halonatronum saccharophilum]|uniref:hypothetical protein n=1 Tax=Halonatronum saccharophilum TaxID=150060 RepID=UPI0004BA6071|nr:hypothetical protein [Halonatronum saccharophilum]